MAKDHQLSKEELRATRVSRHNFSTIKRNEIYIVLDSLKVAHNVGTILRLADALLVKKVFICGNTIVPPNKKIKSSSRGAEKWVEWEYRESAAEVVKELKAQGIMIAAVEVTENSIDYREFSPTFPLCLVLGREYDGVSQDVIDESDVAVHLPLLGMCNSINVSTAASVILYDAYDKYCRSIGK